MAQSLPEWIQILLMNVHCPTCQRVLTEDDMLSHRLTRDPEQFNLPVGTIRLRCPTCRQEVVQVMTFVAHDGMAVPSLRWDGPRGPITDEETRQFLETLRETDFPRDGKGWLWGIQLLPPNEAEQPSPTEDNGEADGDDES